MSTLTAKRILFRLTKAPYGSSYAREALDAILAAAAFEQQVSVLFCGEAVYQLLKHQQPALIQQKNFTAAFGLFPMYDLTQVFIEATALQERGLEPDDLVLPVVVVSPAEIECLLRNQHQILSF